MAHVGGCPGSGDGGRRRGSGEGDEPGLGQQRRWVCWRSRCRCRSREQGSRRSRRCSRRMPVAARVIAIEATGSLHRAWAAELERLPSGLVAAVRALGDEGCPHPAGSGRFKTDDRDCAALTYLARQGAGRRQAEEVEVEELRAAVRHRRGLVADRKKAQQRLHDQLNALCPGLSAPDGTATLGRALPIESPTGQAVLACAVAFAGRAPSRPVADGPGTGKADQGHCRLLGRPVARLPATAG